VKKIVYMAAAALSSVLLFSGNVSAETGKSDAIWFAQLVQAHNGKEFCAPRNATLGTMAASLVRYSNAHPELHDSFNDQAALRGLAESYPCSQGSTAAVPMDSINKYVGRDGFIKELAPIFSQLLLLYVPGNFRPVYEKESSTGTFYIAESVPAGESTSQWTQMITKTGAKGLASKANLTPQVLAVNLAHRFNSVCPTSFSDLDFGTMQIDGYDAYALVASCGTVSDASGAHSESTLIVEIKGSDDYYSVQWAVRGPASAQPVPLNEPIWRKRMQTMQPIKLCPRVPGEQAPYPSCAG
jgi:Rap1a immunity proteins